MTEDARHMKKEVDRLMEEMQEQQSKLRMGLAERDRQLGVTMDLGDLEAGMKKVGIFIMLFLSFLVVLPRCNSNTISLNIGSQNL